MSQRSAPPIAPLTARLLPHFRNVRPYAAVQPPERLLEQADATDKDLARLNANENPYGPIGPVRDAIASFDAAAIYPDSEQVELRAALADYLGVPAERIVAGAGSDELIDLIARVLVAPGDTIVTATPTFGMYSFTADVMGARFVGVPRRREDFSIDVPAFVDAAASAALVFLASPNNPTGNSVSLTELEPILDTGVPVVIDEAYVEFSGRSLVGLTGQHPNLIVLRTFSKWAGLAGLRVGYGVFPADFAALLMRVKPPYSVGTLAQTAAIAALTHRDEAMDRVRMIVRDRDTLARELAALPGVRVYPSDANFLLARFPGRDAAALDAALIRHGVSLRRFETPGLEDCLRVSVGRPDDHDRLLTVLRRELEGTS